MEAVLGIGKLSLGQFPVRSNTSNRYYFWQADPFYYIICLVPKTKFEYKNWLTFWSEVILALLVS